MLPLFPHGFPPFLDQKPFFAAEFDLIYANILLVQSTLKKKLNQVIYVFV